MRTRLIKRRWERILQNKYNHLLMTVVFILIAYPLLESTEAKFPIIPLLLLAAITPALWVGLSRKVFLPVITIGVAGFAFNTYAFFGHKELANETILILLILYAVFYFLAIAILMKKISSNKVISSDTIKGGISIYFLLGLFWAVLYMILLTFNENALSNIHEDAVAFDCYYYSFTTLTTLGYGDIAPVAKYAKILAIMEAVTGPVYLAIFVAQLIGLNIAQKLKD